MMQAPSVGLVFPVGVGGVGAAGPGLSGLDTPLRNSAGREAAGVIRGWLSWADRKPLAAGAVSRN